MAYQKRLNIDMCAVACSGACDHCSHGRARPQDGVVSFSESTVAMYKRLEGYASANGYGIRFNLMDRLETLPAEDLSFVQNVRSLSLGVSGFERIFGNRDALVQAVKKVSDQIKSRILEFQISPPFDLAEIRRAEPVSKLVSFQHALLKATSTKSVYLGINQNKSLIPWQKIQHEAGVLMLMVSEIWSMLDEAGDLPVIQQIQRTGKVFHFFHEISIGKRHLALGGRFIDGKCNVNGAKQFDDSFAGKSKRLSLGLFPWGVHADHSTLNINEKTLRFSYREFAELLTKAEETGNPLKSVISEAVRERHA